MSLRLRSSVYGGVPEWPKGTDCKSAASSFGGSNPPSSTRKKDFAFCKVLFSVKQIPSGFVKYTFGIVKKQPTVVVKCAAAREIYFISHFASAAGLCKRGRYFAQCPCNFVEIRL